MTTESNNQGAANAVSVPQNGFSLISNEKLQQLYSTMVKCRRMAERLRALAMQNSLPWTGDPTGNEAVLVGAGIDLRPEDTCCGSGSGLLTALMQGTPAQEIFSASGSICNDDLGQGNRLHAVLGSALTDKTIMSGNIAVVFWSGEDGSEAAWNEAQQVAGAHTLPILFVCQRSLRVQAASLKPDSKAARGKTQGTGLDNQPHGFPVIPVDGEDVVAVYRVASESMTRARQGRGPTLIQCRRYTTGDPLQSMEQYLTRKGLFSETWKVDLTVALNR